MVNQNTVCKDIKFESDLDYWTSKGFEESYRDCYQRDFPKVQASRKCLPGNLFRKSLQYTLTKNVSYHSISPSIMTRHHVSVNVVHIQDAQQSFSPWCCLLLEHAADQASKHPWHLPGLFLELTHQTNLYLRPSSLFRDCHV